MRGSTLGQCVVGMLVSRFSCSRLACCQGAAASVHVCVLQAKITLIRLYQRFTFELREGQDRLDLRETITISAADGVHVRATSRPPPSKLF